MLFRSRDDITSSHVPLAETVGEFIEYVKTNPGRVAFASSGTGASPHMSAELFMALAGIKMTHVPYRGGARYERSPSGSGSANV